MVVGIEAGKTQILEALGSHAECGLEAEILNNRLLLLMAPRFPLQYKEATFHTSHPAPFLT